ncbi:hypothetical protein M9H77_22429 [Catharanthus roseus]|uniref:Uncharacterized protein n=1 Tax=Catharanthus roseus TaxID=4058 RepID=A0ACC0AUH4_CATRO|nr:hypothetical protein M9H77_22429 [Catharanthus roseus]
MPSSSSSSQGKFGYMVNIYDLCVVLSLSFMRKTPSELYIYEYAAGVQHHADDFDILDDGRTIRHNILSYLGLLEISYQLLSLLWLLKVPSPTVIVQSTNLGVECPVTLEALMCLAIGMSRRQDCQVPYR